MAVQLIRAPDLAAALEDHEPLTVLDVRWRLGGPPGREAYDAGHVSGAVFVDLETELSGPPSRDGGRHPLPDVDALQRVLRAAGVGADTPVVVYDAADSTSAARAWWLLRWAGLADVRVLDGGIAAWIAAGRSLEREAPSPRPGDVTLRPGAQPTLDADGAQRIARDGRLLDARAAERYRGEVEPVDPVAGHIPGAISAPTAENVGPDGRFLDAARLRERFAALGVDGSAPVGVYCGSGVTAAHEVLALALAGIDASLYPGSWSAWVGDGDRPIATGGTP